MRLRTLNHASRATGRGGFTLVELLVVVAILLVLTSVAVPIYMSYLENAKLKIAYTDATRLRGDLQQLAAALNGWDNITPGDWSLLPLPAEKMPPLDPWGTPYMWTLQENPTVLGTTYVPIVWSCGPNKTDESGGGDDIVSN